MYQQGASAYQQTAVAVETPRDREAALLMKAAIGIQRVRDAWPSSQDDLSSALTFNRKLWTVLMTAVTREDSPLSTDTRQGVANLGLFILNETREILDTPVANRLDPLININRQLAAGLRER